VADSASYGSSCWKTDAEIAAELLQANGKAPHPKSVARSRKEAAAARVLNWSRIFPSKRPKFAKYRISAGTTEKFVNWKHLGIADPSSRSERHKEDLRVRSIERAALRSNKVSEPEPRPRYIASEVICYGTPEGRTTTMDSDRLGSMDPEIARMALEMRDALQGREQARHDHEDAAMLASVPPHARGP